MIKPRTDKQRHWAKILEEAESSEMSLAEYARANNLGVQTLYQWRSTLKVQHQPTQHCRDSASEERHKSRQTDSAKILNEFKQWLDDTQQKT